MAVGQADATPQLGTALVSRRPVHGPDGAVRGFVLRVTGPDDAAVTARLLDAFSRFSAADLFGGRPGFVNVTRAFVLGTLPMPVGPGAATLLIPPAEVDDAFTAGLRRLRASGYTLALDGWRDDDLAEEFDAGAPPPAELLDIESLSPGQAVALELVGRLSAPETQIAEIENVVRHSPELAVRLLKVANSASSASRREVGSLHDAIVMVGVARLRSWMLLLSLSPTPGAANAMTEALIRAATGERLARLSGRATPESAFTVGLLDGVAAALAVPADDLLDRLPALAGDLADALRGRPGPLRDLLDAVIAYQQGEPATGVDAALLVDAYLEALAWTTQTSAATRA